jgi:histidinol-phosphate/aromatic aminotransferase/cobyric acid decarboxylase-like protein
MSSTEAAADVLRAAANIRVEQLTRDPQMEETLQALAALRPMTVDELQHNFSSEADFLAIKCPRPLAQLLSWQPGQKLGTYVRAFGSWSSWPTSCEPCLMTQSTDVCLHPASMRRRSKR